MRIVKPEWVNHCSAEKKENIEFPIYSVDIHPDETRFVTGGMSDGFGLIAIWSLNALQDPRKYPKNNRKLFQMNAHHLCVNCVRWSPNGKWLASCGTDKNVNIWEKIQGSRPHSIFGCKEQTRFTENWKLVLTLRGHSGDVQDLAWHLSSRYLASSSVDNSIIVWYSSSNVNCTFKQITVLKGHGGFVKGVAWDPAGRYLASQSDDKTLRVWRVHDWSEETKIKEIYDKTSTQSQFMRLSWSPDGSYIASTVAVNNCFPCVNLIDRKQMKPGLDLIGHKKHVTCTRFNPNILKVENKNNSMDSVVIAIGSKDRSISVWSTISKRAVVIIHDLFVQPLSDLTWSKSSNELIASSFDGSIAYISFSKEEIGTPWTEANTIKLHKRHFGCSALLNDISQTDQDLINLSNMNMSTEKMIPETPEMMALQLEVLKETAAEKTNLEQSDKQVTRQPAKPITGPSKQIETRTVDGKRRITPKFLGGLDEEIPEEEAAVEEVVESQAKPVKLAKLESPLKPKEKQLGESNVDLDVSKDRINDNAESIKKLQSATLDESGKKKDQKRKRVIFEDSSSGSDTEGLTSVKVVKKKPKEKLTSDTVTNSTNSNQQSVKQVEVIDMKVTSLFDEQSAELNPANGMKKFVCSQDHRPGRNVSLITIANDSTKKKYLVSAAKADKKMFSIAEKSAITCYAYHENWFILGNGNGELSFYDSNTGDYIFPTIQVSKCPILRICIHQNNNTSQTASMANGDKDNYQLYALSSSGTVSIWTLPTDLMQLESISTGLFDEEQSFKKFLIKLIKTVDMSHTIKGYNHRLKSLVITESNDICIQLSKGSSFLYHQNSQNWIVLLDSEKDPLLFRFIHSLNSLNSQTAPPTGFLHSLQIVKQSQPVKAISPVELKALTMEQKKILIQFLKNQIRLSLLFESNNEIKFWIGRLIRSLVEFGFEDELRSLFMDLIGPIYKDPPNWNKNILNLSKRSMAAEFLKYFGLNLSLQKLYQEIKETLDSLNRLSETELDPETDNLIQS